MTNSLLADAGDFHPGICRRAGRLELSDTQVYEPLIRALLGTASHVCEVLCLNREPWQTLATSIPAFVVGLVAAHFLNAFVLTPKP